MSAISLKSITGITSITTPAGVDNQLTLHTNNTTERVKIDIAGNVHVNNHLAVSGITTTTDNINIDADNKKLKIGESQDLELFHNGTNSVINNTEGALLFQNNGSSSMYIASDGQVSLNNDITFIGASANALWDKSENYFSIPDKIVHSGDTNTAIRFPTDNMISFETGGSEQMKVAGTNITLGTNSTTGHILQIKNRNVDSRNTNALGLDIQAAWMRIGDALSGGQTYSNGLGIKFHDGFIVHWSVGTIGSSFYISNTSNAGNELFPSSRTDALVLTNTGKVGIGTDSPQEDLTIMSSTPALMLRDSDQPNSYTQVSNANQDMYFSANGASAHANFIFRSGNNGSFIERLRIASNGKVGVGVNPTNYPGKFVVSGDALICDRDIHSRVANSVANSDRGFLQSIDGVDKLHLYADNTSNIILEGNGGSERLRIASGGEFLIGRTSAPNDINKLVVTGTSPADAYDSTLYLEGSETSGAVNTGGALAFGGHDGSSFRNWGNIYGMKENGTSGNTASYIAFHTRPNGGNPTERLRIGSAGQLGVGSTAYYGQAGDCLVSQGTSVGVAYTAIPNIFDSSGQSISDYGKMRIKFKTVAVSGTGNVHLGLCRGGVPGNCVAGEIGIPIGFIPGCEYNASFTVGDISVTPWPASSNRYEYYVNISAFSVAGSLGIFYLGQD